MPLDASSVMTYRLAVQHVGQHKLPVGSLAEAARAGLQDGSPRSGILSLHARVEGVEPDTWEDPSLAQVFFRASVYLVAADDVGIFTLGALPIDAERQQQVHSDADAIARAIGGGAVSQRDVEPLFTNLDRRRFRRASSTGRFTVRWDARDVILSVRPPPDIDVDDARDELALRFFRYLGPATTEDFRWWVDATAADARAIVDRVRDRLTEVDTPRGPMLISEQSAPLLDGPPKPPHVVLLPPDDPVFLRRTTSRWLGEDQVRKVWPAAPPPGVVIVDGVLVGRWRRQGSATTIELFTPQPANAVEKMEDFALGFPIESDRAPSVRVQSDGFWHTPSR